MLDAVVTKARGNLLSLSALSNGSLVLCVLVLSYAMERLHLEYCVLAWAFALIRDITKLKKVQEIASKCVPRRGYLS